MPISLNRDRAAGSLAQNNRRAILLQILPKDKTLQHLTNISKITLRSSGFLSSSSRRLAARRIRDKRALLTKEIARLRAHFSKTLKELWARDVSSLSASQRLMRERLLYELARYARAGRFPRNIDFPGRLVPYFVDAFGTRCAMAHLIESTGETHLVARVAHTANNALVREIEDDPELQAWLERAGLTATEAGRIQPSYCFVTKGEDCFCNSVIDPIGVLEATILTKAADGQATMSINAIHGNAGNLFVGQEVTVFSRREVGDAVLVQVTDDGQGGISLGNMHRVQEDGTVALSCNDAPALQKADAIQAMLEENASCIETLRELDDTWAESICEGQSSLRCSAGAVGSSSSLFLGALTFAALLSRRRRRSKQSPSTTR